MPHRVIRAKASQRAWLSIGAPILGLVLVVALGALLVFVNFAQQQNRAFQQDSSRLVDNAMAQRGAALTDSTLDFASWNDAYQNISVHWNGDWVRRNYYSAVTDGFVVFRAPGTVRHAWFKSQLNDDDRRLTLGLLRVAQAIPGLSQLEQAASAAGTVTHSLTAIDGNLAFVSVAVIAPEDAQVRLALHANDVDYLASVKSLTPEELAELGVTLDLENLHFERGQRPPELDTLAIAMFDATGARVGELRWHDERPGDAALSAQLPLVVIGLFAIGALAWLLTRWLVLRHIASITHGKAAAESSKLKSQFIATMSHGLRTPLNAIIGYAELIEEESTFDPNYRFASQDASRIIAASRQLRQLVDDTLDQSRIDAGGIKLKREQLSVRGMLSEIDDVLSPLARENGNSLEVSAESSFVQLVGDHQRVRQCLLNVAGNAVKFTKDGAVRVRARQAMRRGKPFVTFDVEDTGAGIDSAQAELLFEPYNHADGSVGLGLAIARKLARAMGGDIEYVSEPGKGSCFSIHLPVERERVTVSAAQ